VTRRGWVLFVALGIIWGLPYLLIKISVREISPVFLVFLRTAGGSLLLGPIAIATGAVRPILRRWKPLLVYTFVEIVVPWLLLFNAERKLSSSLTGLLVAAVPLAGAALAVATGSDRLDGRRLAGLLLGLGGVAALVGLDVSGSSLLAALSLGGVAIGYALGPWVLARHLSDLPSLGVVAGSLVVCAVLYAPLAAFEVPHRALSASVIESVVALTVICTAVAFLVFFALIGEIGPMRTTVITYVNPAVAVLLGVSVLGERVGAGTAVGFVLILGGSFLATGSLRNAARGSSPEAALATPPIAEP
jgi:drug/metabolite transporter (DMT)-like permease